MGGARIGLIGAVALLVGLLAPALLPGAATARPHRPAPPGISVTPRPAPTRAPTITTGRYVVPLPAGRATYLRLRRTTPGTALHVGLEMVGRGGSVGEGAQIDIGTRPGRNDCGTAVAFRPTLGEAAPLLTAATSTWTSDADHPCARDRTLFLRLRPATDPLDAGRPVQLRVYEEPAVDETADSLLTTPSPPTWVEIQPGTARSVRPAGTVDDAPVVTDGTYAVRIRPGRTAVLAVPLTWGDSLRVQLDAVPPDPTRPGLDLSVLNPLLDRADTGLLTSDLGQSDQSAYRAAVMTQDIAYLNRESVDARVNGADLAGMHYVVLRRDPADGAGPLAVDLTVQVRPGDGTAPLYSDHRGLYPPAADSRLVDGSLARAGNQPAAGASPTISVEHRFPWLTVGGVVLGLAVLGGLIDGLLHLRRRRAARRGD